MAEIIPIVFEEIYEELESREDTGSSLTSDAHGLFESETFADIGTPSPYLTKENVISELEDLDYYEKVSLAFLLCDEVNYILERLMTAERARTAGSLIPVPILSECLGDRNGRGVDIHKLKTILKGMDETTVLDSLESSERATVNASVGYRGMMSSTESMSSRSSSMGSFSTRSEPSITSQHSVASATSQVKKPQGLVPYPVDPDHVGYCLIINQKNFYKDRRKEFKKVLAEENLETRLGTDMDRDRLINTFESMGFTTCTAENLTHEEMLQFVDDIVRNDFRKEHSCLVLCIMSHGAEGVVYGSNSVPVSEAELQEVMQRDVKLRGKPKILIIQACQGKAHQEAEDIAEDGPSRGKSSDFLKYWSTVPGFASFRHEIQGTWFIQSLSRRFLSVRPTDDFFHLFTSVNDDVTSQRASIHGRNKIMVPEFKCSLTKLLVLPLQPERRLAVSLRMAKQHLFILLLWEYIESRKKRVEKKHRKF
ncbi:hypothetical protein C0J52_14092 [Blattella germanica]|nr:hypothetical protein C0J52_14092 [Blattella germanica]